MEIKIKIPDGKLCRLTKKGIDVIDCPCCRTEGSQSYSVCGLFNESLDGTINSIRKCDKCKNMITEEV